MPGIRERENCNETPKNRSKMNKQHEKMYPNDYGGHEGESNVVSVRLHNTTFGGHFA